MLHSIQRRPTGWGMLLTTRLKKLVSYAPHNPSVHNVGNNNLLHALLLPVIWTYIKYTAFQGVDVRSRSLSYVPRAYLANGACDLGCSVGHMSKTLQNVGVTPVVGLDTSESMLHVARLHAPTIHFETRNVCLDLLPTAGLYSISFLFHEMPVAAQYTTLKQILSTNSSAGILVVDIDPVIELKGTPETGQEPYIADYLANVERMMEDVARKTNRKLRCHQIVPGKCKSWFLE